MCYSDCNSTIKLISESVNVWRHYVAILHIKVFLIREWRVQIFHNLKEGNVCADYFAKHGASNDAA